MNNDVLNRRPLSETARRIGSSKMFLSAIILSFVGLGLSVIALYFEFSAFAHSYLTNELLSMTIYHEDAEAELAILFSIVGAIALALLVASVLINVGLLRGYRYFSGKTNNAGGFDLTLKIYKIVYIVYTVVLGILGFILFVAFLLGPDDAGDLFVSLFFLMPLFAAIIGGSILLLFFQYKAIKKTMNFAMAAANDVFDGGGVSVFLIVISIIGLVSSASSLLQLPAAYSTNLTVNGEVYSPSFISVIASIPQLISNIFYLVLMFKFKSSMNTAIDECRWILKRKAEIAQANARAEAAAKAQAEAEAAIAEAEATVIESQESETVSEEAVTEELPAEEVVSEAAEATPDENDETDTDDGDDSSDSDVFIN